MVDSMGEFSKVLVTGGAGFIGSHIVVRLLSDGYDVMVLDDLSSGSLDNVAHHIGQKEFRLVKGDVRDAKLVREVLKGVDAVFHEAAFVSVTLSVKDPVVANDVNVAGTLNVLKASADLGVKRFVFASSAAVYGETSTPLKSEDMASTPLSPYGVSKLAAESYVRSFYRTYGLETVSPSRMFIISNVSFGMIIPRLVPILRIFAFNAILIKQ